MNILLMKILFLVALIEICLFIKNVCNFTFYDFFVSFLNISVDISSLLNGNTYCLTTKLLKKGFLQP